jgi:hypothetical protein
MHPARLSALALSALLLSACQDFASQEVPSKLLGTLVPVSAVNYTIVIGPGTTGVNVTGGDIVRFVAGDKVFAISFDGSLSVRSFDLQRLAPPGTLLHPVMAYVLPNPLYSGNDKD